MCKQCTFENLLNNIENTRERLNKMLEFEGIELYSNDVLVLSQKLDNLIVQYENCKMKNHNVNKYKII